MGPFKCPECGIWWAGLEHRCRPSEILPNANPFIPTPFVLGTGTSTVRCNCDQKGKTTVQVTCPIHDVQVTYT